MNGGLRTLEDALEHLRVFDGVMIGREAYQNPYLLALLHRAVVDPQWSLPSREEIVERYVPYVRDRLTEGHVCARWYGTCKVCMRACRVSAPGADSSRRCGGADAGSDLLIDALRIVRAAA